MSTLLAKRYKNNKSKAPTIAQDGKKLSSKNKVEKNNKVLKFEAKNIQLEKEPKTLMLD